MLEVGDGLSYVVENAIDGDATDPYQPAYSSMGQNAGDFMQVLQHKYSM